MSTASTNKPKIKNIVIGAAIGRRIVKKYLAA